MVCAVHVSVPSKQTRAPTDLRLDQVSRRRAAVRLALSWHFEPRSRRQPAKMVPGKATARQKSHDSGIYARANRQRRGILETSRLLVCTTEGGSSQHAGVATTTVH